MKKILIILFLVIQCMGLYAQDDSQVIAVEGTELAKLPYVLDILKQTPRVSVSDNTITVIGRGTPAIYVGNRKVTELTELSRIASSYVSSITVMTQPGAEYGKDVQAVIVIEPVKEQAEGLTKEATLRLNLTNKLATNAEVELDWKRDALNMGAFLAFNEEYEKFSKETFKYYYENQNLVKKEKDMQNHDRYRQRVTGSLFGSYALSDNSLISLLYTLTQLRVNRTYIPEISQTKRNPETRHDINLEYAGMLGAWQLTVGNNIFFNKLEEYKYKPVSFNYYLRRQTDVRTYAVAKTPFWQGNLSIGAEHEYDYMNIDKYEDVFDVDDAEEAYFSVHAKHPDHTVAVFTSTSQKFGNWTIEAGLRYEYRNTTYRPCPDDGMMKAIDQYLGSHPDEDPNKYPIVGVLYSKRELHKDLNFFFPSLKIVKKQGASQFTLYHTQSSVRPNLGFTRLSFKDLEHLRDQIVRTEKVATTSLDWKYRFINLTATYTHYCDPICSTMDGYVSYNAPDYNAFDFNTTLAPRIGVWSPVLNVNVHKQWFDMPLANGKGKLYKILCRVSLDNTISLPSHWLILANSKWHGKGGERNWYFYKPDFSFNASVQKELPRQHLTIILSAQNIFGGSYTDVTRYTQEYNNISEGAREENLRNVSLTVKYRM